MIKQQSIWVEPYLYKYIKQKADFDNHNRMLLNGRRILLPPVDNRAYHDIWFSNTSGKKEIVLLSRYSGNKQLYAVIRYYKTLFFDEMLLYIEARHSSSGEPIDNVWSILQEFLKKYNIYESDYSMENAYKYWQRSTLYKRMKTLRQHHEHRQKYG